LIVYRQATTIRDVRKQREVKKEKSPTSPPFSRFGTRTAWQERGGIMKGRGKKFSLRSHPPLARLERGKRKERKSSLSFGCRCSRRRMVREEKKRKGKGGERKETHEMIPLSSRSVARRLVMERASTTGARREGKKKRKKRKKREKGDRRQRFSARQPGDGLGGGGERGGKKKKEKRGLLLYFLLYDHLSEILLALTRKKREGEGKRRR